MVVVRDLATGMQVAAASVPAGSLAVRVDNSSPMRDFTLSVDGRVVGGFVSSAYDGATRRHAATAVLDLAEVGPGAHPVVLAWRSTSRTMTYRRTWTTTVPALGGPGVSGHGIAPGDLRPVTAAAARELASLAGHRIIGAYIDPPAGQVLQDFTVEADRDCRALLDSGASGPFTASRFEVTGLAADGRLWQVRQGLGNHPGITAQRADVHHVNDGIVIGPRSALVSSWVHDNVRVVASVEQHRDGAQLTYGGDITLASNLLDVSRGTHPACREGNAPIMVNIDGTIDGPVRILDNHLTGGHAALNVVPGDGSWAPVRAPAGRLLSGIAAARNTTAGYGWKYDLVVPAGFDTTGVSRVEADASALRVRRVQ